MGRLEAIRFAS